MTATGTTSASHEQAPEGDRGHPGVALAVLLGSGALALAGVALTLVVQPPWGINQWFFAVDAVDAVVYGVVTWLVLSHRRHPVAWILAVTAVGGGLAAVGAQWSLLWVERPDLPALGALQLAQSTTWVPGTLALIVVVPWLLRREPLGRGATVAVGLGGLLIAFSTFVRVTDPFTGFGPSPLSPVAIRSESWVDFIARSSQWENGGIVLLGLLATVGVLHRRRRAEPADRPALAWLALAVGVLSVSFLPLALPGDLATHLPLAFTPILHLVSQALYPVAVLGAVLRQRLWDLDLGVRRTLTWWVLTTGLVVAYVALVSGLGAILPGEDGAVRVLATALVAAGFQPARTWVQRHLDGLVHGEALRPARVVARVGTSLGAADQPDDLLTGVLEGLVASLRLGHACIDAPDADGHRRVLAEVAGPGGPGAHPVTLPLLHRQQEVARLVVAPRPNERLDGRSLGTLEEVAPVVAATVALADATRELARSRARLVEAREEERRVLRRELHDGLGPALAGIGLGLQASRNLLDRDPERAVHLLDTLCGELDARVEEVRDLARGLLPPALDAHGLVPAVLELAERHRAAGLTVEVVLEPADTELPALPPAATGAVYGIVAEAVRNVARHAGAAHCRVRLAVEGDGLHVQVADDGTGIGADAVPGVGTRSMRERAEGVGGILRVGPGPEGGTVVEVVVPTLAPAEVGP